MSWITDTYTYDPAKEREWGEELASRPARIREQKRRKREERAAKRAAEEAKRRAETNETMRKAWASIGKEHEWTPE